jgi:predicted RNA binding protein YcfA (HicA-like mRNA interferase family)
MSEFPSVSGKDLLKFLKKEGFDVSRVKGSHHFLKHLDGRCTTVPVHKNENIGRGLLLKILRDCEIDKKDFMDKFC